MKLWLIGLPAAALLVNAAPAAALAQAAVQTTPAGTASEAAPIDATPVEDPWEPANRAMFRLNQGLDKAIVRPVAMGYKHALPRPVRTGVRNVLDNIDEPNTLLNDVLQAKAKRGANAAGRFVINTTIGVLGVFDVATAVGLPKHYSDFGQTLGRWGVASGPYIFVPVIGPSDLRDGAGRIVDGFFGLLNIHDLHVTTAERFGVFVVDGLDTRVALDSTLEDLNRTATDPYVTERSAYLQQRRSMVTDTQTAIDQLPSFDAPPPTPAPAPVHSKPQSAS